MLGCWKSSIILSRVLIIQNLKDSNLYVTKFDISNEENQHSFKSVEAILESMNSKAEEIYLLVLLEVYLKWGKYVQEKLPLTTAVLKSPSSLDL